MHASMKKRMHQVVLVLLCLPLIACGQMGYTETGEASYYADKFNGRLTASGERFNNKQLTAAHRVLPFGTKVLVTELESGKTVVVRINDRGPFKRGRIIDLSKAAAVAIGITQKGVAKVKIEVVDVPGGEEDTPPVTPIASPTPTTTDPTPKPAVSEAEAKPAPTPTPKPTPTPAADTPFAPGGTYNLWGKRVQYDGFCLQLTALSDLAKAKALATRVKDTGWPTVYIRVQKRSSGTLYKVVQGVYKTEEEARAAIPQLKAKGFACFLSHYRQ